MPKFDTVNDNLEQHKLPNGNYGFSATKIDNLGATEYTLATIVLDESGSVSSFKTELEACVKEIINACKLSPRADNLMVRVLGFSSQLKEIHGFKLLSECNLDDYNNIITQNGMTALYDASVNAVESTTQYGKQLCQNDFSANGIVFVLTDGVDNQSSFTQNTVKDALAGAVKTETLESLVSVLIGVNITEPRYKQYLEDFKNNAGFTQFIDLGSATKSKLAKLAEFISKSISAQSQALGSNGPSQSLTI